MHGHIVESTKYRYGVSKGEVQLRCRELIRSCRDSMDIRILRGIVGKDHIYLHLNYSPTLSVRDMVKRLIARSGRLMLDEFAELKSRYWDQHLWGIVHGAWCRGYFTDEMILDYLDHHKEGGPNSDQNLILELFQRAFSFNNFYSRFK